MSEIQRKNHTVSPINGAVARPRGGARAGAGRKPDPYKHIWDRAIKEGVTPERAAAIIESLVMEASTGNVQAANVLLDRMLGKVPQAVQHQGAEGGTLKIVVEYEKP